MSELKFYNPSQFKIKEIVLVTKVGKLDITPIYEEINIFDSLFMPVISGNIVISDSIGLSSKLLFDGSESILFEMTKVDDTDVANFKKSFRIYKQGKRSNITLNSEIYVLYFVSDELIFSDQQRINQSYENTYSEIIKKIMTDYLKIPDSKIEGCWFDNTSGLRKVVIPNLRPLEAIQWCAKRSVDEKFSPNYMFYENITGFNFAKLSNLLKSESILDAKFEPKNITDKQDLFEWSSIKSFEVISQTNEINRIRSGVNAGKFIGFDPITRIIDTREISFEDHFYSMEHGNKNPTISIIENRKKEKNINAYNSKKTVNIFGRARQLSSYIQSREPESISKQEDYENYIFQRKAILENLMTKRIKLIMPGNFQLSSGFNINLVIPNLARKEKGDSNDDISLNGKYIIVASRHIIKFDRHETIIEVATTSTDVDLLSSSSEETLELLNYE